jgi:hypothetical protein
MATKKKMVTGLFRDRVYAQNVYEWLHNRGYTPAEINVLMAEGTRSAYLADKDLAAPLPASSAAAEGVGVGGAIGTAVGATLGALLAIGSSLVIPGLGLVVAGPLAAAFAGGGAGAVAGGLIGGQVGLNNDEPNARAYQEALRTGGVVIGVVPHNEDEVNELEQYFMNHRGENVCYC